MLHSDRAQPVERYLQLCAKLDKLLSGRYLRLLSQRDAKLSAKQSNKATPARSGPRSIALASQVWTGCDMPVNKRGSDAKRPPFRASGFRGSEGRSSLGSAAGFAASGLGDER